MHKKKKEILLIADSPLGLLIVSYSFHINVVILSLSPALKYERKLEIKSSTFKIIVFYIMLFSQAWRGCQEGFVESELICVGLDGDINCHLSV